MNKPLRIGFVGLDTSHVTAFAKLLNDASAEHHVPGGKVVAAFPGGSSDFPLSYSRVGGFTDELRGKHGVKIMDSPEAVAEAVDLLFIESADGRVHLDQFRRTVRFRRPTFIDKPMTTSLAAAQAIARLAQEHGVPVMSCSSLRFSEQLFAAMEPSNQQTLGPIVGCDVFGPMPEEPTQPGLFWYGVHCVEMLIATLGTGCVQVQATSNPTADVITALWSDGRIASMRGQRNGVGKFGALIHFEKETKVINATAGRPGYSIMLEAILASLPAGRSAVPIEQTLEVIRFIEAANRSRASGQRVALQSI